jgi:hypothetical protein
MAALIMSSCRRRPGFQSALVYKGIIHSCRRVGETTILSAAYNASILPYNYSLIGGSRCMTTKTRRSNDNTSSCRVSVRSKMTSSTVVQYCLHPCYCVQYVRIGPTLCHIRTQNVYVRRPSTYQTTSPKKAASDS